MRGWLCFKGKGKRTLSWMGQLSGEEQQKRGHGSGLGMDTSEATAFQGNMHGGRSNRNGLTVFLLSQGTAS